VTRRLRRIEECAVMTVLPHVALDLGAILDNMPSMLRSSDLFFPLDGSILSRFWLFHHGQNDTGRMLSIMINGLHSYSHLHLTGLVPAGVQAAVKLREIPAADFCGVVRDDSSTLSPMRGPPADLLRQAVIPSVGRRPIDQAQAIGGWRTSGSRARSSQRTTRNLALG
jgi:hypothetical protein